MRSTAFDTETGGVIKDNKFRAIQFSLIDAGNRKDMLLLAWGMDAWFGNVPFFKTMAFLNGVVWGLMWLFRGVA